MTIKANINARLKLALESAQTARGVSLPAYRCGLVPENKAARNNPHASIFDPVTQADLDTEKHLRRAIETAFPQDGIVGEELGDKPSQNGWSWCLDPIDGTRAFVAGVPVWSTLIGISHEDKPLIGIADFPALNERFIGVHGKAWRETIDGKTRLRSAQCTKLEDAVLACTEPLAMLTPAQLSAYEKIRNAARFSRLGLDAYGYALVAAGGINLVIEAGLAPYDIMALIPIIEGAGGKVTNWDGAPAINGGEIICASTPELLNQVYPYLRKTRKSV